MMIFVLFSQIAFSQNTAEMTLTDGSENSDLQTLFDFENIGFTNLNFTGESIRGKYYILKIKEYENGKLVSSDTLFSELGNKYFKIDSTNTSFKFLTKIGDDNLKIWIRGLKFGSRKSFFPTYKNHGNYVVKDFLGVTRSTEVPTDKSFYIFAVITPSFNPDGSASYCRVAQSGIDPEKMGLEYNIPHYYLIEMQFI